MMVSFGSSGTINATREMKGPNSILSARDENLVEQRALGKDPPCDERDQSKAIQHEWWLPGSRLH